MFILGHRGAVMPSAGFSQNSLAAFRHACALADGFETDACLSRDGGIFLIHDSNKGTGFGEHLDAASAKSVGRRSLSSFTTDEVAQLRLQGGESLPTLDQALSLITSQPGKIINIELKAQHVARPVIKLLRKAFAQRVSPEAVILSSFDPLMLAEVRQSLPEIKIGALLVGLHEEGHRIYQTGDAVYAAPTEASLNRSVYRDVQPNYFIMPDNHLTTPTLALIERLYPQAQLGGWTVTENGPGDYADLLRRLNALPAAKLGLMIVDDPGAFRAAKKTAP